MKLINLVLFFVIITFSSCKIFESNNEKLSDLDIEYYIDSTENIFIGLDEINKNIWIGETVFNKNKPGHIYLLYFEYKYEDIENDFGIFSEKGNVEHYFYNPTNLRDCNYIDSLSSIIIYPANPINNTYYFNLHNQNLNCFHNSIIGYGEDCYLMLVNIPKLLNKKIIIKDYCTPYHDSDYYLKSIEIDINNVNSNFVGSKSFS